jgi:hypothetical protein
VAKLVVCLNTFQQADFLSLIRCSAW